jgi:Ca2+:H+ antiporter
MRVLLWFLAFVPVVFVAHKVTPESHTLLFLLSVVAIVPLAALLSHATESVAARTGDAVGGLLNATLGNLTELVIAIAALRAGEYMLVKASIAGAIVTNSLFMLGGAFLLGGLRHHVQEYNAPMPACRRASCSWPRSRFSSPPRSRRPTPQPGRHSPRS